jgi:Sulfatase-modifying factor enzyme 1
VAATCSDGIQDGMETDKDCGGPSCMACGNLLMCGTGPNASNNCQSKVCTGGVCQVPTCNDGVQNGTETDIDCGGSCPPCHPGQKCGNGNDCAGNNCQGNICQCPTGMVVAPIQGGGIYCIDAIEVSYGLYQVFYDANPPTATQPSFCAWNTTWTPANNWPQPAQNANDPVTNVNWCQAAAYCSYSGRRLCGKIGGGSIAQASFADFAQDQWYNACTAGGVNVYPYGSTYNPTACWGADFDPEGGPPESWTTLSSCIGGETGLLEMSGNVAEWEDACGASTGANDLCAVRGGSYLSNSAGLRCDSNGTIANRSRNFQGPDVGFRCCL